MSWSILLAEDPKEFYKTMKKKTEMLKEGENG